jgi:ribosomal protein S18 acetylase RimI-like enzyme
VITYSSSPSREDVAALPEFLAGIDQSYPDFERWLARKAVPSLSDGTGKIVVAKQGQELVGVALGKHDEDETKIRCVRVAGNHRKSGIGATLIEKIMVALDCDKPLLTVPQTMIHDYARLLVNRFDYDLTWVERGMYVEGALEYVFNGTKPGAIQAVAAN